MDKRMAEAHIEWITDQDETESVIRAAFERLGWIHQGASIESSGRDSFLIELNDTAWAELRLQGFIAYVDTCISFGMEYEEDEDPTAGFIIPQDR